MAGLLTWSTSCLLLIALAGSGHAEQDREGDDDKSAKDGSGDDGQPAGNPPRPPRDPKFDKAQKLFDAGIAAFNEGRFEDACDKFQESLALVPGVGTRGKLAECWARMGRVASAHRLYLEVERLAREDDDRARARVARQRANRLLPRLPYLTIDPGPSVTLDGFKITRNGRAVEPRTFKSAVAVDPGEYVITATARGHNVWKTTVRLGEAKKKNVAIPMLLPGETRDGTSGGGGWSKGRIAAVALVGVGAASLFGGTTYFGLRASNKWQDAEDDSDCELDDAGDLRCRPGTRGDDLANDALSNANLANLTAGIGLAAISAGVFLWWRSGRSGKSNRVEGRDVAGSLRVTPAVSLSNGGSGIVVSGQF